MPLADRIRLLRGDLGVTKASFSRLVGVTPGTVTRWENGARTSIDLSAAMAVAKVCRVSVQWVETGVGPMRSTADERPTVVVDPAVATEDALGYVLRDYEWPDVDIHICDEVERTARKEAATPEGRARSVSLWRMRVSQLIRSVQEMRSGFRKAT